MKFLKNIILLLLLLFVIGAVYLATLDGNYDVAKTRLIKADPIVVFNDLNDYKNWMDWGPWYEKDSTIRVQYENKTIGEGGAYAWTSDIEGGGRMKTLKVQKPERLDQEIVFETPFGDMASDVYWILNCWAYSGFTDINKVINNMNQLAIKGDDNSTDMFA